jgi:hypothetical protein
MKHWIYRIVLTTWCLIPSVALATRTSPSFGSGTWIEAFATAHQVHLPPVTESRPHPAWLKPAYLLGTWQIIGKWGMTAGEALPAIHKTEEEQIGRVVTFTKKNIIFTPPFLDVGIHFTCAAPPRYTVKVIPIHIHDVVLPKSYLQWSAPTGDYTPYRQHEVVELKAECAWHGHPHMPFSFTFQLTRTGELAYGGPGFYLLKKVGS